MADKEGLLSKDISLQALEVSVHIRGSAQPCACMGGGVSVWAFAKSPIACTLREGENVTSKVAIKKMWFECF